jgi:hypothetical protein
MFTVQHSPTFQNTLTRYGYNVPTIILSYSPVYYITLELKPCVNMYHEEVQKNMMAALNVIPIRIP